MGASLWVHDINIVARLHTASTPVQPNDLVFQTKDLSSSLSRLGEAPGYGLIRFRTDWTLRFKELTEQMRRHLSTDAMEQLRKHLRQIPLMGFAFAASRDAFRTIERQLSDFRPSDACLFLATEGADDKGAGWDISGPTPPASLVAQQLDAWPGIAFWSYDGHSAVVPLPALPLALAELSEIEQHTATSTLDEKLKVYERWLSARSVRLRPLKLLHLSDLHFGTEEASRYQNLLFNHLENVVREVGRVIITGDLMTGPESKNLWEFEAAFSRLASLAKSDPIVV